MEFFNKLKFCCPIKKIMFEKKCFAFEHNKKFILFTLCLLQHIILFNIFQIWNQIHPHFTVKNIRKIQCDNGSVSFFRVYGTAVSI